MNAGVYTHSGAHKVERYQKMVATAFSEPEPDLMLHKPQPQEHGDTHAASHNPTGGAHTSSPTTHQGGANHTSASQSGAAHSGAPQTGAVHTPANGAHTGGEHGSGHQAPQHSAPSHNGGAASHGGGGHASGGHGGRR